VYFSTLIPLLSLLKSVLLKSVLVQAVLLRECSMVPLFMLSILVEKSKRKKNGKFGEKFPFLCVFCDLFLTSFIPSFPVAFRLHSSLDVKDQASQKLNNTCCTTTKFLNSVERYYQLPCAWICKFIPPSYFLDTSSLTEFTAQIRSKENISKVRKLKYFTFSCY